MINQAYSQYGSVKRLTGYIEKCTLQQDSASSWISDRTCCSDDAIALNLLSGLCWLCTLEVPVEVGNG